MTEYDRLERRKEYKRNFNKKRLANETLPERKKRLERVKENQKKRLANETLPERKKRLERLKENQKKRLANETLPERKKRLERQREIQSNNRANMTILEKEKMKSYQQQYYLKRKIKKIQEQIKEQKRNVLFKGKKFTLFAFDLYNLINSMKKMYERKGIAKSRHLHPLNKIKSMYFHKKPFLSWFFVPEYYKWAKSYLPESKYVKWHTETNPKTIKGHKGIVDVDVVIGAVINHLIHQYHNQIDCFYYGMGDIDSYYPIKTAKEYGIKVIAVAIENRNINNVIRDMVDNVVILYPNQ